MEIKSILGDVIFALEVAKTVEELVTAAVAAKRSLRGAYLSGAYLSGARTDDATKLDRWSMVIVASRHVITATEADVRIGCHTHSIEHWLANYESIGSEAGYTPEEISEYGRHLTKAASVAAAMSPGGAA